ncbi:Sensor kinase CusS [Ralstonia pickettii]|uniref:Sensor protein n=2 Tax=Pseudomonadota TaxID=1224 RepID=A0AAD2C473_9RALS|nr:MULTISPECIES: heavy metal sensor histidine kinase [Ralstonia]NPT52313.1 heavy metal sensor histidine kinase [Ralstonia sp. 3N]OKQ64500.1 two-component sensor histidine kinase [Streptococcus pneumoniae]RUP28716.1 MAG: HAMP domain-containing protein [Curvibacter sp.]EFP68174.1 heavy metal sensor kinase [Ralstonia pickettii]EGY61460.1 heavy metal sensor kinase [Ralstonia sp. 5_2_56FAA]
MARSLIGRLTSLFSILVTFALASMGAYAYYALDTQLRSRDVEIIEAKLTQVSHLVRDAGSLEQTEKFEHSLFDLVRGYDGLALRLRTPQGRLVYRTADGLRSDFDLAATGSGIHDDGTWIMGKRIVEASDGVPFATVSVAKNGNDRRQVVIRLGNSIVVGILVGAVLTALLGALITRRELRPAQALIQQVHRINVERLSYRVDAPSTPTEVHEIGVAFNAMLERLESGYERLYRFSADLAHDLRTPLNNLIGHTEVALSREREVADYVTLLEDNLAEYQRLSRMIDSMLFLARADAATVELDRVPIELGTELSKLASYFAVLGEDKGVKIEVSASGSVSADLTMFRRAVGNLLSNAVRHADNGSVVSLNCQRDEDSVTVHVLNQGVPIPDKDRERVFDRFYRGDQARSHSDQSTGLGLAIVRSIMELHAGTASVATFPGSVTRFSLRFPFVD